MKIREKSSWLIILSDKINIDKNLKYFWIISIILIAVTCKNEDEVTSPKRYYFTVKGVLYDFMSDGRGSPGMYYAKDVKVVLGNDSTISDSKGEFIFNNILDGEYTFSISSPIYEPYSRVIQVPPYTYFNIILYGKKGDYFPIRENLVQKFKYHSSTISGGVYWSKHGEAVWKVFSSRVVADTTFYNVEETLIYSTSSNTPGFIPTVETVFTKFDISESKSHEIQIRASCNGGNIAPCFLNGAKFNRFNDMRRGNIIEVYNIAEGSISLKKDVGFYILSSVGSRHYDYYELIE